MSQDPLSRLCVARLTRLLEINCLEDLQKLEDCAFVAHNVMLDQNNSLDLDQYISRETKKKSFKILPRKESPHGFFGEEIQEEMLDKIVILINHLKLFADTEGLFRISGNKKRQEELKALVKKSGKLNISFHESLYNPHDVAGVLKQFFGDLEEPLLTKQLYECYQQVAGNLKDMDSVAANEKKKEALQFLFLLLPPLNRLLLKNLLALLAVVASKKSSKMCAYNLGVVFAPSIVCTRKPVCCLTEYAFTVEPFTDLVCFLIENSEDVFKIPSDFIDEAHEYLETLGQDKAKDEVPLSKAYCQQIGNKEFTREARDHTLNAVMLLYSQMMDLPEGPTKTEFMEKFKQSYPGTPMFVPKSVREQASSITSITKSKDTDTDTSPECVRKSSVFRRNFLQSSVKKAYSEPVIPLLDDASNLMKTPKCSQEFLNKPKGVSSSTCEHHHGAASTPSTPGAKVKECFKRIRRNSAKMFKLKGEKPSTPVSSHENFYQSNSKLTSKVKDVFRRSQRISNKRSIKILKKSISTPILSSRGRVESSSSSEGEQSIRKLSFDDQEISNLENVNTAVVVKPHTVENLTISCSDTPCSNTTGMVNLGFNDTPSKQAAENITINSCTPVIKKTLYPCVSREIKSASNSEFSKENIQNRAVGTPVIKKPIHKNGRAVPIKPFRQSLQRVEKAKVLGDITNNDHSAIR